MKVLLATALHDDYLSACLWDGLQEFLGEENVVDAVGNPNLHSNRTSREDDFTGEVTRNIGAAREGRVLSEGDGDFDLMVLCSCFLNDHSWHDAINLRRRLRPGAKVAFVEVQDGAHEVRDPARESVPAFPVDAFFRREIDPHVAYPYDCRPLGFAAPSRWFVDDAQDKVYDVFFAGNANFEGYGKTRWDVLPEIFRTQRHHRSIVASWHLRPEDYFHYLRQSKLAVCPVGAAGCDALRTYEAAACGAIPVFVNYPVRRREPWFDIGFCGGTCFACNADVLGDLLDSALGVDLRPMRARLLAHARAQHTTRARAERLLRLTGVAL